MNLLEFGTVDGYEFSFHEVRKKYFRGKCAQLKIHCFWEVNQSAPKLILILSWRLPFSDTYYMGLSNIHASNNYACI